jgi:hypothetical protein
MNLIMILSTNRLQVIAYTNSSSTTPGNFSPRTAFEVIQGHKDKIFSIAPAFL